MFTTRREVMETAAAMAGLTGNRQQTHTRMAPLRSDFCQPTLLAD